MHAGEMEEITTTRRFNTDPLLKFPCLHFSEWCFCHIVLLQKIMSDSFWNLQYKTGASTEMQKLHVHMHAYTYGARVCIYIYFSIMCVYI